MRKIVIKEWRSNFIVIEKKVDFDSYLASCQLVADLEQSYPIEMADVVRAGCRIISALRGSCADPTHSIRIVSADVTPMAG